MQLFRITTALVLVVGLGGCSSDQETAATVMPTVQGLRLDVALSDIKRAGFGDDVEVVGGGVFGVVVESNWMVCEQSPAAGQALTGPRLTVDRSCDGTSESDNPPAENSQSEQPSETSVQEPMTQDNLPVTTLPIADETITVENSEDLAALLAGPGPGSCDESVAGFATKYQGRDIQFDGFIAYMDNHEGDTTRFDFLIYVGDYRNEPPFTGPSFVFIDEGYSDLGFTGPNIPVSAQAYDNLSFVATVGEYDAEFCNLRLRPVSTQSR